MSPATEGCRQRCAAADLSDGDDPPAHALAACASGDSVILVADPAFVNCGGCAEFAAFIVTKANSASPAVLSKPAEVVMLTGHSGRT